MTAALSLFNPDEGTPEPSRYTVAEVIDRFWVHATATGRYSERASVERRALFDEFVSKLGDRIAEDCKGNHLTTWIDSHDSWKSAATKRSRANWLKAPFKWAADEGLISNNPFRNVSYEDGDPREPVADVDYWRIFKAADQNFRRLLIFLRFVGCRSGEASALTWPMIDFERRVAVLKKHKTKKKTGKARVLFLTREAVKLLRWMQARAVDLDGFVFRNRRGNGWTRSAIVGRWDTLRERTGTAGVVHGIRHAWGNRMCAKPGANIKLVSVAMGHASVTTTERFYLKLDKEIEAIRKEIGG